MIKKVVAGIILLIVISFSLIVYFPMVMLSDKFSNYDSIDKTLPYYYTPSNASIKTDLTLFMDRGQVEIKYIDPSYSYSVKIEIHLELHGANIRGKSYLDYFNILWKNESSQLNLTMMFNPFMDLNDILFLLKDISIVVFLRQDIIFDIFAVIDEGKFDLFVPFMVSIDNVWVNINKGDIYLNFFSCLMGGNITGTVRAGNIDFIVSEVQYSRNCIWNLTIDIGKLSFDIHQDEDMGANVTGFGEINYGELRVVYQDDNPNVGSLFIFHHLTSNEGNTEGFWIPDPDINEDEWWLVRLFCYSYEFPGLNYYNISLFRRHSGNNAEYVYDLSNTNSTG